MQQQLFEVKSKVFLGCEVSTFVKCGTKLSEEIMSVPE